jgi:hypothetical protein
VSRSDKGRVGGGGKVSERSRRRVLTLCQVPRLTPKTNPIHWHLSQDCQHSHNELLFRSVGIALSYSFVAFGCPRGPRPSLQDVGEAKRNVLMRFSAFTLRNIWVAIVVFGNTSPDSPPVRFSSPLQASGADPQPTPPVHLSSTPYIRGTFPAMRPCQFNSSWGHWRSGWFSLLRGS